MAFERVDVDVAHDPLDFGFDPAVAVQRPVQAAGHQRLFVHPGDGGSDVFFTGVGWHGAESRRAAPRRGSPLGGQRSTRSGKRGGL